MMEDLEPVNYQFTDRDRWSEERIDLHLEFQRLFFRGAYHEALSVARSLYEHTLADESCSDFECLTALVYVGRGLIGIQDYTSAGEYFTKVLRVQEENGVICPRPYAAALLGLAEVYIAGRLFEDALGMLSNSIAIITRLHRSTGSQQMMEELANSYTLQGGILLEQGAHANARDTLFRAIDSFRRAEVHSSGLVTALYYLSLLESEIGNSDFAYRRVTQAVRLAENLEHTDSAMFAQLSVQLGMLALDRGDYDIARKSFRDAIFTLRNLYGYRYVGLAQPLCNFGHLEVAQGNFDAAEQSYLEALDLLILEHGEDAVEVADVLRYLGRLAFDIQQDYRKAAEYLSRACRVYYSRGGQNHFFYREALWSLSMSHLHLGDATSARSMMEEVMPLYEKVLQTDPLLYLDRLCWYISINRQIGQVEVARERLQGVESALRTCPPGEELADLYCRLASLFAAEGMKSIAREYFERAQRMRLSMLGANAPEVKYYESEFQRWKQAHAYLASMPELASNTGPDTGIVELRDVLIPGPDISSGADEPIDPELVAHVMSSAEFYAGQNRVDFALQILDEVMRSEYERALATDAMQTLQQQLVKKTPASV